MGGAVGLVILFLIHAERAGPLQEPFEFVLLMLVSFVGAPVFPAVHEPSIFVMPGRVSRSAFFLAWAAFVLLGMAVGWMLVWVWRRVVTRS